MADEEFVVICSYNGNLFGYARLDCVRGFEDFDGAFVAGGVNRRRFRKFKEERLKRPVRYIAIFRQSQ